MSEDTSYISVIVLCVLVLICLFIWFYRKTKGYSQFPAFCFLPILFRSLLRKIPNHMTPMNYCTFQVMDKLSKFQSEGLCVVWFWHPLLVVYSEEASKVLTNSDAVLNKTYSYRVFHELFGTGLLTSKADVWYKRRKVLQTAFYTSALKGSLPQCNERAKNLVQKLRELSNSRPGDLMESIALCTFSNVCEFVGLDINDYEKHSEALHFMDTVKKQAEIAVYRFFRPWFQIKYVLWLSAKGRKFLRQTARSRKFIRKLLLEMKSSVLSADGDRLNRKYELLEKPSLSFARLLIHHHLKDPSFTLKDMVDELTTVLGAGFETVTHTLMWCLYLVGLNPDVQTKLYEELKTIMKDDDLSYNDLSNLTYLNCVVKETLRLYTTIPDYGRYTDKDVRIGKYLIPKGTNLIFYPYMMHRDPKIFPDPEKFYPDRFLEKNSLINAWNFTPFAEGKRNCIGKNFALLETKVILAHVIKNFTVTSLQRREDIICKWTITLTTEEHLKIRLQPREKDVNL